MQKESPPPKNKTPHCPDLPKRNMNIYWGKFIAMTGWGGCSIGELITYTGRWPLRWPPERSAWPQQDLAAWLFDADMMPLSLEVRVHSTWSPFLGCNVALALNPRAPHPLTTWVRKLDSRRSQSGPSRPSSSTY